MSSCPQCRVQQIRTITLSQTQLVFRKLASANEDLAMIRDYLNMAEASNRDLDASALPGLVRLLDRVMAGIASANVLLCPALDPEGAKEQEKLAMFPELDEFAA